MTAAPEPGQYTALTRVLHWLTAALVFCALFIGFVMVNSVGDYSTLIMMHRTLGVTILVVVLVRLVNRLAHRAPPLPSTVGALERKIVVLSEVSLYALLLLQPLIGWAMVSAAGGPVVVFGSLRLPRITVRRAVVLAAAAGSFGRRVCTDSRNRRAHFRRSAAHLDVARPDDRKDDIPVGP